MPSLLKVSGAGSKNDVGRKKVDPLGRVRASCHTAQPQAELPTFGNAVCRLTSVANAQDVSEIVMFGVISMNGNALATMRGVSDAGGGTVKVLGSLITNC